MGNRAHADLLRKYPWMRNARAYHRDGPPVWLKRQWNRELRSRWKTLAHKDPDTITWPTRAGNIYDWY